MDLDDVEMAFNMSIVHGILMEMTKEQRHMLTMHVCEIMIEIDPARFFHTVDYVKEKD